MDGLGNGIKDAASKVVDKAKGVVNDALAGAKKLLGIKSPSREFKKIGMFVDEGFIIGLDTYKDKVVNASEGIGQASIDGMSNAISSISNIIDEGIDDQPTIRPVIDLDDVYSGMNNIDSMFNKDRSIGVMSKVDSISSMMGNRQNGVNGDVVSAINDLKKSLGNTGNTSYTINGITYDDGSNIAEAMKSIVRAARVERRI